MADNIEKEIQENQNETGLIETDDVQEHSHYAPTNRFDASIVHHLDGMYQNWFWTMRRM